MTTLAEFGDWVHRQLFFLDYAPVIFISAKEGFNLERLLKAVRYVAEQARQRIPTAVLNRTLHDAIELRQADLRETSDARADVAVANLTAEVLARHAPELLRIARQRAHLERHANVGLVATRVVFEGDRARRAGYARYVDWTNTLLTHEEIAVGAFVESPLAHPSVTFRRELVDARLLDETIVVYVSDHGEMLGEHGLWWKSVMYESAVAVPLIMAGPDVPRGAEVETNAMLVDLFPTLRDAVGVVLAAGVAPEPAGPQFAPGQEVTTTVTDASLRDGPGLDYNVIVTLALAAPVNHSWGISMHVTARGLTSPLLWQGRRAFTIRFDFVGTCGFTDLAIRSTSRDRS